MAVAMALWTLMVSVGFTVNSHWCGGELLGWSVFTEAEGCAHQQEWEALPPCHKAMMEKPGGCCHEESTYIQSFDEEAPVPVFQTNFSWAIPVADLLYPTFALSGIEVAAETPFSVPEAPPPIQDIPIFIQQFLI
ncbi:MAG TPA: hypothetical protein DCE41_20810 [Cytophagales bacterium]|nr:hypothetical protein [Cytophagales bacterium]HAA17221.1 hypothetical protein [Cytophagales bacterium]HAP62245.1 hypothetical protein [Cytophagales bacterium]